MTNNERRQDARLPLQRRVKLVCQSSGRCLSGSTHDVSASGCLIDLDETSSLSSLIAGAPVRVGIDWTGRQGILQTELMPPAQVVRMLGIDGRRHVAISYAQRQELAATA